MAIDLVRKEEECNQLRQELSDEKCINNYLTSNKGDDMDIDLPEDMYIDLPNISKMSLDELK